RWRTGLGMADPATLQTPAPGGPAPTAVCPGIVNEMTLLRFGGGRTELTCQAGGAAGIEDAELLPPAEEQRDKQSDRAQVSAEAKAPAVADHPGVQVDPGPQDRPALGGGSRRRAAAPRQVVADGGHVHLKGPLPPHDAVADEVQPPPGAPVDQDAGQ